MATPHPHDPPTPVRARIAWLTVSDTRDAGSDSSGDLAQQRIEAAGHQVAERAIVPDEPTLVRDRVSGWIESGVVDVVRGCGGTGISSRDRTFEALSGLMDQRLDGFGELFRVLSYEQVKSRSMLSRAAAGIAGGKPLFLMPGSTKAVELALSRLILPEIPHLLAELAK